MAVPLFKFVAEASSAHWTKDADIRSYDMLMPPSLKPEEKEFIYETLLSWIDQMAEYHGDHEPALRPGEYVEYHYECRFPRYAVRAVLRVV